MSRQWLTPVGLVDETGTNQWNFGGVEVGENASVDANASGAALTVTFSLSGGAATGGANATGLAGLVTFSLSSGAATGAASASGASLTITYSASSGAATGEANAGGMAGTVDFSLSAGEATATANPTATGMAENVTYLFAGGIASSPHASRYTAIPANRNERSKRPLAVSYTRPANLSRGRR